MDYFISLLARCVLNWWLLDLCVFGSIEVIGSLEINSLYMSVNLSHQLPHT